MIVVPAVDPRLRQALISRAVEELTAVAQYTVRESIFAFLGLDKLAEYYKARKEEEAEHFQILNRRALELGFILEVPRLNPVFSGAIDDIPAMVAADRQSELDAIRNYTDTIELTEELGDDDTRVVIEEILGDEVRHEGNSRTDLTNMGLMTFENWLSTKA